MICVSAQGFSFGCKTGARPCQNRKAFWPNEICWQRCVQALHNVEDSGAFPEFKPAAPGSELQWIRLSGRRRMRPVKKMRAIGGNLLLAILSFLLGLTVLEVGARIVLWSRPPGKSGEQAVYTKFDPVLGWRNKPGASVVYNRREYRTTVTINALGFRDVERSLAKPADRPRVLVLGDSFIEAYGVELEESLTRRLEAVAGEAGCLVDVMNAGVHG